MRAPKRLIAAGLSASLLSAGFVVIAGTKAPAAALPADGTIDVYAINRNDNGKVAVHVAEGSRNFGDLTLSIRTPLDSGSGWRFAIADYEGDGVSDLYAINPDDGGRTSVHVLGGASNFQTFVAQFRTPLHSIAGDQWAVRAADHTGDGRADVYAINKNDNGMTAVHVLDAASGFQTFSAHEVTAMHATTDSVWDVFAADYNGDAVADLYAVNKNDGGKTSVHVFDGRSRFQTALVREVTAMHATTDWVWSLGVGDREGDGYADLFAFNGSDIATSNTRTTVHVADGMALFGAMSLQQVSAIGPVASDRNNWELLVPTRSYPTYNPSLRAVDEDVEGVLTDLENIPESALESQASWDAWKTQYATGTQGYPSTRGAFTCAVAIGQAIAEWIPLVKTAKAVKAAVKTAGGARAAYKALRAAYSGFRDRGYSRASSIKLAVRSVFKLTMAGIDVDLQKVLEGLFAVNDVVEECFPE